MALTKAQRAERDLEREVRDELRAAAAARVRARATLTLTAETIESIAALVLEGQYPESAARSLGVPRTTFRQWLEAGENEWAEEMAGEQDPDGLRMELFRRVDEADARSEVDLVREMCARREAGKNWSAWMTHLQRRWPDRWDDKRYVAPAEDRWEDNLKAFQLGADAAREAAQ